MSPVMSLSELAEKVEKSPEGIRFLDEAIAKELGWSCRQVGQVFAWFPPDAPDDMHGRPPRWTRDITAAVSLTEGPGRFWSYNAMSGRARITWLLEGSNTIETHATGETAALAITAASLRAQAIFQQRPKPKEGKESLAEALEGIRIMFLEGTDPKNRNELISEALFRIEDTIHLLKRGGTNK